MIYKKGQALTSWIVDAWCAIALILILMTFLIIFSISDMDDPDVAKIGVGVENLKNTDVLLGYLHAFVALDRGEANMAQLVDLYTKDKGVWRRVLEKETADFLGKTHYFIGVSDKTEDVLSDLEALLISPEGKEIDRSEIIVVDTIQLFTSSGKTVWVGLLA